MGPLALRGGRVRVRGEYIYESQVRVRVRLRGLVMRLRALGPLALRGPLGPAQKN